MDRKIVLPGGAGLVGQNLVARLKARGYRNIVVLDKHRANIEVLRRVQPDVTVEFADVAEPGDWQRHFADADTVVMLQAQIGGNDYDEFVRNNVESTALVLEAIKGNQVPRLVHISSSVVESVADDFYTRSKKAQEKSKHQQVKKPKQEAQRKQDKARPRTPERHARRVANQRETT